MGGHPFSNFEKPGREEKSVSACIFCRSRPLPRYAPSQPAFSVVFGLSQGMRFLSLRFFAVLCRLAEECAARLTPLLETVLVATPPRPEHLMRQLVIIFLGASCKIATETSNSKPKSKQLRCAFPIGIAQHGANKAIAMRRGICKILIWNL